MGGLDPQILEKKLARANQQLYALRQIGLALESTMTFDEVLTMAVERTTTLMGAQRTTLFLLDDSCHLVSRVMEGGGINEISLEVGQGLAGWVARHGLPVIVPDVYEDDRFDPRWDKKSGFRTKDVLCHPILGRHGAVIGVAEVLINEYGIAPGRISTIGYGITRPLMEGSSAEANAAEAQKLRETQQAAQEEFLKATQTAEAELSGIQVGELAPRTAFLEATEY